MSAWKRSATGHLSAATALRVLTAQATVAAVTLAWSLSFISFLDVKEAALWIGVILLWGLNLGTGRDSLPGFWTLAPCWWTLGITVLVGTLIAPVPYFALDEGLRLLPLLLFASLCLDLLHDPVHRVRVLRAIPAAGLGAALLALFQGAGWLPRWFPAFAGYDQDLYSVFGNEGLLAGFLAPGLVCLPGVLTRDDSGSVTRFRLFLAAAVSVTMYAVLILTGSRGGMLALLLGFMALIYFRVITPRAAVSAGLLALLTTLILYATLGAAPWSRWAGTLGTEDPGGNFRPWVWRAGLYMAAEHPMLGAGFGNFAREIPRFLGASASVAGRGANTLTTYHAHLDLLECFCETGLVGVILLVWILSRLRGKFPAAICGLIALAVFSCFHPAWHSTPHALAGLLLYATCAEARGGISVSPGRARACSWMAGLAVASGSTAFAVTVLEPSFLLRRAEDLHLSGQPAAPTYLRATRSWGFHPEAHESFGIHAFEQGDLATAWREFHLAKRGLDTGRICRLIAMTAAARGDTAAACHWYRKCAERWPWDAEIRKFEAAYCTADARETGARPPARD